MCMKEPSCRSGLISSTLLRSSFISIVLFLIFAVSISVSGVTYLEQYFKIPFIASASGPSPLTWQDCKGGFLCSKLEVPLDYSHPDGVKIQLALIKLPTHKGQQRIGALLTNPGGPGASGVDFVREEAQGSNFSTLRDHFDIVGFDPRGIGRSSPVKCRTKEEADAAIAREPAFPTVEQDISDAQKFDQECARKNKNILPYLSTENTARDMDQIRAALGDQKVTYLGFSYGTYLGATYASLFPNRIRAMVFDGAVDPVLYTNEPFSFDTQQISAFEVELKRFFSYCTATPDICKFGNGNPSAAYTKLVRQLSDYPIHAVVRKDKRLITGTTLESATLISMYSRSIWPILAQGLYLADVKKDGSILQLLADKANNRHDDGSYDPGDGAFNAIACLDRNYTHNENAYKAALKIMEQDSPHFGAATTSFACAYWPAQANDHYTGPFRYHGATPILVLGTTYDPATPYKGAVAMAQQLGNAVLLTKDGDGHTAMGDTPCIDKKVDTYLISLTVPAKGLVCKQQIAKQDTFGKG
jgi:pimeloyl-ACP methyl ester carboxylesterase